MVLYSNAPGSLSNARTQKADVGSSSRVKGARRVAATGGYSNMWTTQPLKRKKKQLKKGGTPRTEADLTDATDALSVADAEKNNPLNDSALNSLLESIQSSSLPDKATVVSSQESRSPAVFCKGPSPTSSRRVSPNPKTTNPPSFVLGEVRADVVGVGELRVPASLSAENPQLPLDAVHVRGAESRGGSNILSVAAA